MISDVPPEFSRPIAVDKLPAKGALFAIEADSRERKAVAERLDLAELVSLAAEIEMKPLGRTGTIAVNGRLTADVVQTCVVTLVPLSVHVEEGFRLSFAPPETGGDGTAEGADLDLTWDGDDPPDPIVDGTIDIGEVVVEHLSLTLDPFPRAEGAAFVPPEDEPEEVPARVGPFARLAELRRGPKGKR